MFRRPQLVLVLLALPVLGQSKAPKQVIWSADGFTGRFYKLDLDGHILGEFGKAGKLAGQFGWTHGIACPSENLIYAAEELNFRVQKLTVEGAP